MPLIGWSLIIGIPTALVALYVGCLMAGYEIFRPR